MTRHGAQAVGERALLVIVVKLSGVNLPHQNQLYDELVFGSSFAFNNKGPVYTGNVRDYYFANSSGRFSWRRVGTVGPLTLSNEMSALALSQRRAKILDLVRDQALFNFDGYNYPTSARDPNKA